MPAEPRHVLEAPSHPSPYPWYAALQAAHPAGVFFDQELRLWVACSEAAVDAALAHRDLRVRPPSEPVPRALLGTATGAVFAQLVRMNDGAFHAEHRPRVAAASRALENAAAEAATAAAQDLWPRVDANRWLTAVPVQAMARLL